MNNCNKCVSYMKCFMNQIGIGSGNFGRECSFYMETATDESEVDGD